jgi:hypothetical protein
MLSGYERAEAAAFLCRLVSAQTQVRAATGGGHSTDWGAERFLAHVLTAGSWNRHPWTEADLRGILYERATSKGRPAPSYESLAARHWIRPDAIEVVLADGVRWGDQLDLSPDEQEALCAAQVELEVPREFSVPLPGLESIYARHATDYPTCPPYDRLRSDLLDDNLHLRFHSDLVREAGAGAAAELWISARYSLVSWLTLVEQLEWTNAPGLMPKDQRIRWLKEARELVLGHSNLGSVSDEAKRQATSVHRVVSEVPLSTIFGEIQEAPEETPLGPWKWWQEVAHAHRSACGFEGADSTRATLGAIVSTIMKQDVGPDGRLGTEARAVLSAAPRHLWLMKEALAAIEDHHLPWLLLTLDHAPYALRRLAVTRSEGAAPPEPGATGLGALVWQSAVSLFLSSVLNGDAALAAAALADVLQVRSDDAIWAMRAGRPVARGAIRPDERWRIVSRAFADEAGSFLPRAGSEFWASLLTRTRVEARERVPTAMLGLLVWVHSTAEAVNFASRRFPGAATRAGDIAAVVRDVLKSEGSTYWTHSSERLPPGDWGAVFAALFAMGKVSTFPSPVGDLPLMASDAVLSDFDSSAATVDQLVRLGEHAHRRRFLMRILMSGAQQLTATPPRATLCQAVADMIANDCVLDVPADRLDLFDELLEHSGFSPESDDLFGDVLVFVEHLPEAQRLVLIGRLLAELRSPTHLLRLASTLPTARERALFDQKVADTLVQRFVNEAATFPELEHAVVAALNAARPEVARRILEYGDRKSKGTHYEDRWAPFSFRMTAALLYAEEKRAELTALQPPSDLKPGVVRNDVWVAALGKRDLYVALTTLDTDPSASAHSLHKLRNRFADDPVVAVNTFAAEVRIAARADAAAQGDAYRRAMANWTAYHTSHPEQARLVEESASYNQISALLGSGETQSARLKLTGLDRSVRLRPEFVQLGVAILMSLGERGGARELVVEARTFHGDPLLAQFDALLQSIESGTAPEAATSWLSSKVWEPADRDLKAALFQIRILSPQRQARVVDSCSLEEFVARSALRAIVAMLDHLLVLRTDATEDDYTYLVGLTLNAGLGAHGWSCPGQTPGGSSDTGIRPGERDMVYRLNNQPVALYEALLVKRNAAREIKHHLDKVVKYYDTAGCGLYIMVIYAKMDLESCWTFYKETLAAHDFGSTPIDGGINTSREWTERPWKNARIRVGETRHGPPGEDQFRMYHLAVDVRPPVVKS